MRPYEEPLSKDEWRREVAINLAVGIMRLHARAALAAIPDPLDPRILLGLGQDCLDVSLETVLSVHRG